jgi:hypothetical protein
MDTPQHFSNGAWVSNLKTPNNKIVWYFNEGDLTPLADDEELVTHTYWAAQKAGSCESFARTSVSVVIDKYPKPETIPNQCYKSGMTLGDLKITGAGIKWYENELGGDPLPLSTPVTKPEYWASQSLGDCESERVKITMTTDCYDPFGTVFPFVYTGDMDFDKQFVTMAKLYDVPPSTIVSKIEYVRKQVPVRVAVVTYYDCGSVLETHIPEAPLKPGIVGQTDNPGLPIRWGDIGVTNPGPIDDTEAGIECPTATIGKYIFEDVASGDYVLEITRQGFLSRYAVITISSSSYLGHREILGGDVNGDLLIKENDLTTTYPKTGRIYGLPLYNWKYDFDGDGKINNSDLQVIRTNLGAERTIYQETKDWIAP